MLESLALDLFKHDLSIPSAEWANWLKQLHAHHLSVASPSFPQPISRPSSSPHLIIRKAIESLIEVTDACEDNHHNGTPEPVFYVLDEEKKEISEREQAYADVDVLEFDLDEDGPLREEYLPKRRISSASRPSQSQERMMDRTLPPPAKWSPAADEPLISGPVRSHTQYVAPQPISRVHATQQPPPPPPAPFQQALDMTRRIWPGDEQVSRYAPRPPIPVFAAPPYSGYEYTYPPPAAPTHSHSRSQSLSLFNLPAIGQPQGHYRSYSQTQYDPAGYGDVRYAEPPRWAPAGASHHWATFPPPYEPAFEYHQRPLLQM